MAWIIWLVFGVLMMAVPCVTTAAELTALQLETHPFTGDWDAIFKRGTIRIVVPYSRTLYYNDRGTQRGITAAAIEEFQRWLDRKYKRPHRPLTVIPIPTTRDRFFPKLLDGHAEIAAGNLTITEARLTQLEFSDPLRENISEIILTHKSAPTLASIDELAGREVHVRKTSSYYESLTSLNERFHAAGKRRMRLTVVPDELEDEDMMEMMGAGLLRIIVVDDWKAKLWINAIPNIEARSDLALRTGGKTAWAMRKDTPKLKAIVNEFVAQQLKGTRTAAIRLANFQAYSKTVRNSTTAAEWKKFEETIAFFKKYGDTYGFDHLMLAAQGYQESRLDQRARSRLGAIGIMQIMPATGKELGVGDITQLEPNVHGGTKYMRRLFDQYFKDSDFDEQNRTLFAFASYNAGPARIANVRAEAKAHGLDQNKWLNNVEIIASKRIGQETVQYVRNIFKYYTAYRLQLDALSAQNAAKQRIVSEKKSN